ncbi:MAG: LamG domain-containing protein, partial [Sediminibacterium sp.]|nr:LamG domain-containing protein [Sediminibacterium sp.]
TWVDIPANNNRFKFKINNLKGGRILVRSNLINRAFNSINIVVAPTNFYYGRKRIDTFFNLAAETTIPNIDKGGSLNLKFSLINNTNPAISVDSITGVIRWNASINVGTYNIRVRATNEIGYIDTGIILYIYRPIFNEAKLYSNNSFQTTNIGTGLAATGGDYIRLPTINLNNTNYTIETWFRYRENTISSFKRIFDFGQNAGGSNTNILLCFKSGTPVTSPVLFFFAGAGQQADISIPASINIRNWNHYALVLNGTIASLYINGTLMGTYTGLKATANYTSNFIGRSNDNSATTLGNWQDFRVWNKVRTQQEIKNYFKSRIIKYEDSIVYNLLLNGKYTSSIDYLANGAKLPNDASSKDAVIDSAIITSANNTGARYVFDSTNQHLYGTITNELSANDSIQISYDNGTNWVNVDTVVQNTWAATLPTSFTAGTIRIRSKLVNRNFSNFVIKIKPSYFTYTPNLYANLEGVMDSTQVPSIRSSTPINYILKTNKNGYSINSTTGRIYWDTTIVTTKDILLVTAKNDIDSISTNVYVNIGDSVKAFSYSVDTLITQYFTLDSSILPIINGSGVKTYSIIAGAATGISINENTGVIYVANTASVGTYNLTIQGRSNLNSIITKYVIKVLPNAPIFNYADTAFTVSYTNVGSSNYPIVNKTGITNRFKIISGNNIHIIIDSITGEINNLPRLYNGTYNLQVELSNLVGADTTNFTINIENYADTVHGFYNTVLSKSTYLPARSGDYIALPTLDLKNTSYTIETWFKYNGTGPVNSFIRIFDFNKDNPPSGANTTNILMCFSNVTTIDSPTLLVFAGNGQYSFNVPANNRVNIRNWNHYALVYNASGTTASVYINGVLITASIPALASTQDFLNSFIGVSNDNSFSTIGSFKEFKIWKRPLSAQELTDQYKTITNTFKNKLYYYLP